MINPMLLRGTFYALLCTLAACGGSGTSSSSTGSAASTAATTSNANTVVALSASTYSVPASARSAVVTVSRTGGAAGAATVNYTTMNGTAAAGTDYTATSGTLSWSDGDTTAKSFTVPVSATTAAGKGFNVALTAVAGAANFGSPTAATVNIASASASSSAGASSSSSSSSSSGAGGSSSSSPSSSSASSGGTSSSSSSSGSTTAGIAIHVLGNTLVDGNNNVVQLRGANISALEGIFSNPATNDLWENAHLGTNSWWSFIKAWKINAVRIPMNEASWLGYTCTNRDGSRVNPDAAGLYKSTIARAVADANAAGIYVILDLHWTAPQSLCPVNQDQLPDADNSVNFWTSVANTYKGNPAVIFDLFNEPYSTGIPNGSNPWQVLRDGATLSVFSSDSGTFVQNFNWQSAGMQAMLNAVRATGSTNVVMIGGLNGASDLSGWLAYKPSDPLNQLALSWHAYGGTGGQASAVTAVLNAGIPVIIGETGDASANGTTSAPNIADVTSWADQHGASVLAWAWDNWGPPAAPYFQLVKDALGTPTDGEGVAYKAWLARH